MRSFALLLFTFVCLLLLDACMSPDDRDFYAKGWLNPKDQDAPTTQPVPVRPSPRDTQPGGVVPSARSDGDWSTPPPFETR